MNADPLSGDFRLALQAVTTPTLVHGVDQILLANAAMQRLLGYAEDELRQMPPHGWAAAEHAE